MNTPAPWTVSELDASGEVSAYHIFVEPNVAVIERKISGQDQHDMADARLIAAAPALLAALEHVCACLSVNDYGDWVLLPAFSLDRVDAAIKKAKGEA